MAFNGKWKRVGATNVDDLVKASGASGDKAVKLKAFLAEADVVEDFSVTDAGSTRKVYVNGEFKREVSSQFGQAQERETLLGKSTVSAKKVSDTCIEVSETGGDRPDGKAVITVDGATLYLDYTIGAVTCRRTFQKQ